MMVQVIADGADGYRLMSADNTVVGWVRGRAIGVAGFDDEQAVVSAAIRAYGALAAWLDRQHLPALPPLGAERARFVHDGAHRWIVVGRAPVARFPVAAAYDGTSSGYAFEIVLRGAVSDGMAIHAALIVLRAVRGNVDGADIAWSTRRTAVGVSTRLAPTTHLDLEAG
jgi:hypothetical protein